MIAISASGHPPKVIVRPQNSKLPKFKNTSLLRRKNGYNRKRLLNDTNVNNQNRLTNDLFFNNFIIITATPSWGACAMKKLFCVFDPRAFFGVMIRLFVRVGIAASFLTFSLTLYLLFEVHTSRSRSEKKIHALRSELQSIQKNLTSTEQLLKESLRTIRKNLTSTEQLLKELHSANLRNPSRRGDALSGLSSSPFCEIPNTEHLLRLTDKDIVR